MFREDLYSVTVTVEGTDGKTWRSVFSKFSGGAAKSKTEKYRPANGTQDQVDLGGPKEIDNIKVSRLADITVNEVEHWLIDQDGRGTCVVVKQPLDDNGAPWGKALVYSGKLEAVTPPNTDANSPKAAEIELEISAVTPVV